MKAALKSALHAELVKISTVRGLRTGAVLAVLAVPLTSLLVVSTGGLGDRDTVTSGAATGSVIGLLAFGAWAAAYAGSEYVHQTITVSLSTVPRRTYLLGAKLTATAVVAGAGALLSAIVALALVNASVPSHSTDLGSPAALFVQVLAVVAVAVVGTAIGTLVRSTTAGIAIVAVAVLLPKAAAGLLGSLQPWVVGASPGTVITQAVQGAQLTHDQTYPGGTALAVLTMVGVAVVVSLAGGYAFARRDG